ncbi:hypothetical protein [Nocardia spumae]|uniref:hypothetical protein n=1 Tax=Nocardia spumae TaxID=2887190 RepID=UPI001D14ECC3|nr:hypothetical protein [Nocardia spumae]
MDVVGVPGVVDAVAESNFFFGVVVVEVLGRDVVIGAVVVSGDVEVAGTEVRVRVVGSAGEVDSLGSAVTVTIGGSAGAGGVVEGAAGKNKPRPGTPSWTERLAVAEKLAPSDAPGGAGAGGAAVVAGIGCVVVTVVESVVVTEPGSAADWVESASTVVLTLETLPATGSVLTASGAIRAVPPATIRTAGSPASASESFPCAGIESVRAMIVRPIAVVAIAATTPVRVSCRRHRQADEPAVRRSARVGEVSAMLSGTAG